jgi:hypothetical protein
VGRQTRSREVDALVKRFRLSRLTAMGGDGQEFTAPGKPVEFRADFDDRVTTVFFRPRAVDLVDDAPGESPEHVAVVDYDDTGAPTQITIMAREVAP